MNTKFDWDEAAPGIVYVKSVDVSDLPTDVQEQAGGREQLFALHDADGAQLALVADRRMAEALARQNDMEPLTVH